MGIIVSLFIFLLFLLSYQINKNTKYKQGISLCTEFIVYWFLIVAGGCLHLYGLYDISIDIYLLVLVGVISFFIGYRTINFHKTKKLAQINVPAITIEVIKLNLLFYIVLTISLLIIIKQIILLLPILIVQGITAARTNLQIDETLVLSGPLEIIISYFAKPFAKASLIVIIINCVRTRITWKSIFLIAIILGIYFFSEGGRAVIMDVFFIFFYAVYSNRDLIPKKIKKKMIYTISLLAILPIIATIERGADILFAIYTYYCGSLQFLSQAISYREYIFEDHLWGITCFQGFIKPITGLLQIIGIDKPEIVQDASDFIIDAQTTVYKISPTAEMNYFYTTFGYSYKDAGILGVIIFQWIFGIICRYIDFREKTNNKSIRWLSIKAAFFYCILYTMSYYPFAMYLHAMTLVYIYISLLQNIFVEKKL